MRRFFRAIRRTAIGEDRLGAYLLYAVGEILLVVFGILIALQVNNWNDERKKRSSEQVVLGSLLEEFERNRESLRMAVAQNQSNIASALEIGQYTGPDLPDIDEGELSTLMVGAFKEDLRYTPSLGGLYEVINSGKLSILSDPDLRTSLAFFESVLDRVRTQEEYVIQYQELAHRFFIEEGNFRRHLNVIEHLTEMPSVLSGWRPSRFPNNDFRFLENRDFESYLYLYIVAASNMDLNYYATLGTKMDSVRRTDPWRNGELTRVSCMVGRREAPGVRGPRLAASALVGAFAHTRRSLGSGGRLQQPGRYLQWHSHTEGHPSLGPAKDPKKW